ncbi:MAG TPA: DMT family transporter [Phycisphaerae bacterium]|nr:DMT family transporter [Phycisphaerae bacterium]
MKAIPVIPAGHECLMEAAALVSRRRLWLARIVLVLVALFWSLNGPLIKLLSQPQDRLPAVTIACYRSLIGGLVLLLLAWRQFPTLKRVRPGWLVGAVLVFSLMTLTFVVATTRTAAANAIVLQYSAPIWVFLLSPLLLKERFHPTEGLVLLIAMSGVAVIYFMHPAHDKPALLIGLMSGLGYGLVILTLRRLRAADPMAVTAMNFLGSGLLLLPLVGVWGSFAITSSRQLFLLLTLSLVQMSLPYLMFAWALRYVEAHRASLIVLLETIFNPILTYAAVGEPVPRPTLIGGPLILLGVIGWIVVTWRASSVAGSRAAHDQAAADGK